MHILRIVKYKLESAGYQVLTASDAATGLALVEEHTFLPYQYFLVLRPGGAP